MALQPSKLFETIQNLSEVLSLLQAQGIRVEVGEDFVRYYDLRCRQVDRGPMYPMFDVTRSYIDGSNGFWICGFGPNGELVHTQVIRLLDLSGITLADHMALHRHKYITPDSTPDPNQTIFKGPKALTEITGFVGYQGDFWLRAKGLGGPRSQGATNLLSGLLLELAVAAWKPEYIFALVPKRLAVKGAHLRYGYTHCEAGAWIGPDQQVTDEDYLIWMDAGDLAASFSRPLRRLRDAFYDPEPTTAEQHSATERDKSSVPGA